MLMRMVQYIRWKLKKMRGKAILAYLSISLALTPQRVVGGLAGAAMGGVRGARSR